jgi:hypothetical protein
VIGQQKVTRGVANNEKLVPVDNEIYISPVKRQAFGYRFNDGRNIAAKRYQKLKYQTKHEILCEIIS